MLRRNGKYIISTIDGSPPKLTVTIKGDTVTYRDGSTGCFDAIKHWKFEPIEAVSECRLCGKPKDPKDTMDNPKPCGCKYTDAMEARDILERIRGDINLAAGLLDKVIGRNIIR